MQRRQAIQHLAALAGGLLALPAWAKGWTAQNLPAVPTVFRLADQQLLYRVVEAILPESSIPGAKTLGIPAFVDLMLADCYEKKVQDQVVSTLQQLDQLAQDRFSLPFADLPLVHQQLLLLYIEQGDDPVMRDSYGLIKQLSIQGFTSSEYVQTTYLEYEMAPAHYYGCVPVKP